MVTVPAGSFKMGSPENESYGISGDETQHRVALSAFAIGLTDVTVGEFRSFANATGYRTSAELHGDSGIWSDPGYAQGDRHPVACISWYDAVAYCNWKSQDEGKAPAYRYLGESDCGKWPSGWNTKANNDISCDFSASGYRLPTEAEWEYAAKGGPAADRSAADAVFAGSPNPADVAWYYGHGDAGPHPVGLKKPNALGLYDMAGNVWQWCQDWYGPYAKSSQKDPRGADSGETRVLRGGAWNVNSNLGLKSSFRLKHFPWLTDNSRGFRLASSLNGG
jgi:formylglycine-generating enzyme required for sulfatase activity